MKVSIAHLLLLCGMFAPAIAADPVKLPAKKDLLIFVLAGQSNMAGRGKPLAQEDQTTHPRVLVLGKDQAWTPAIDPLHWDKPPVVGVGLGLSFAKAVAEALPEKTIGLVPTAFGGSAIEEWAKGAKHYDNAVQRTRIALRDGTLAGFLWHQGESDTNPERAEAYQSRLDQLIKNLRSDLKMPEVPVVVGTLAESQTKEGAALVNAALRGLPQRIERTGCVEAKGFEMSADGIHFNAASYREFGRRFAAGWLKLAAKPAGPVQHTKDSLQQVKANLAQQKAVLVDVRELDEWNAGHLEGARLVPLSKLEANAKTQEFAEKLAQDLPKDRIIYCHCRAGKRAITAGEILQDLGYEVRPLKPGYQELIEAGFPRSK